jgi:hypothetical protein
MTLRILLTALFWLILGFVLFYEELMGLTFDWSTVSKGWTRFTSTLTKKSPSKKKKISSSLKKKVQPVVESVVVSQPVIAPTPVVKKPIIQKAPVNIEEEAGMEDVTFFDQAILEDKTFYASLTPQQKTEFNEFFILDHPRHLVKSLQYTIGGNNSEFFANVFKYIFQYRRMISLGLLRRLLDALLALTQDPQTKTLLHEAFIRSAYARRQDKAFLAAAKEVSQLDVKLHQDVLNTRDTFVYAYVRLAIILEKEGKYQEALDLIQDAVMRNLDDNHATKFESRRSRLLNKKNQ